jgi:CTP-dependent riboflavin kinase
MVTLRGTVQPGVRHFKERMTNYAHIFERAVGERLYPGTINVKVPTPIPIRVEFRISGKDIGEPEQDLLFEKCLINGIRAYRIRPCNLKTGGGGHGDDVLEIACSIEVPCVAPGSSVEVTLFRTDFEQ